MEKKAHTIYYISLWRISMKKIWIRLGVIGELLIIILIVTVVIRRDEGIVNSKSDVKSNSIFQEIDENSVVEDSTTPIELQVTGEGSEQKKYIKWVDFNVTYNAMDAAYQADVESHTQEVQLNWIELLAYLGAKYGGDFKNYSQKDLNQLVERLQGKEETMETITQDMKYYSYYYEAYSAVLGGMVGEYQVETKNEDGTEGKTWESKYGLKAYLPIAKNFPYSDFDDFGVSRTYGYKRKHLGHDMMGQVGTPIVAIESGYVEAIGWNQYGGWRIGIRSFDKKRYYYYAHLRKDFPYCKELEEGSIVTAGQVIGYLGRTGYSTTENTNNIEQSHLHVGLQLIFDESQKEGNNEIWVDCYELMRFLYRNRSETIKDTKTKEWCRVYNFKDPAVEEYEKNSGSE